jgi:hypothetical protein
MDKKEVLQEIFEVEQIFEKQLNTPRLDLFLLLEVLSKTKYSIIKELGIPSYLVTKYLKILFPDRVADTSKVDNWLLAKYGYKQCKYCEEVLYVEDFSANNASKDGLNTYCKVCYKNSTRKYQREYQKRRRALKTGRIPSWANIEKIKEIYSKCPEGYHVDHIVPLQGKNVSGLHVENNLQYLPAVENLKKYNKYE